MSAPELALDRRDPLPPAQAAGVWQVLELIDEDGDPDDVRGFVAGHGGVIIDHWADDRRWFVNHEGRVSWGPIPMAVYQAARR